MDENSLMSYAEGWRRRIEATEARSAARASLARSRLDDVVKLLVERFGATEVILFGSLAEGGFEEHSDIDIAAAGIDDRWFEAWHAAEEALGKDFALDLIPRERARPIIDAAIARGVVLHGG